MIIAVSLRLFPDFYSGCCCYCCHFGFYDFACAGNSTGGGHMLLLSHVLVLMTFVFPFLAVLFSLLSVFPFLVLFPVLFPFPVLSLSLAPVLVLSGVLSVPLLPSFLLLRGFFVVARALSLWQQSVDESKTFSLHSPRFLPSANVRIKL